MATATADLTILALPSATATFATAADQLSYGDVSALGVSLFTPSGSGTTTSGDHEIVVQINVLELPSLTLPGFEVQDAEMALSAENIDLLQQYNITAGVSLLEVVSDNIDLTQSHTLEVNNAEMVLSAENINVLHNLTIAINDAEMALSAENIVLAHNLTIAINDAEMAMEAENVVLQVLLLQYLLDGDWKLVQTIQVLVAGEWKSVADAQVLVAGAWKGI